MKLFSPEVCVLLALDAGNTNITIGAFEQGKLIWDGRLRTVHEQTADEFGALLRGLFDLAGLDAGKVDGNDYRQRGAPNRFQPGRDGAAYFLRSLFFVTHQTDTGLRICYEDPREVGADRVVNADGGAGEVRRAVHRSRSGDGDHVRLDLGECGISGGIICGGGSHLDRRSVLRGRRAAEGRFSRAGKKLIRDQYGGERASGLYYGAAGMIDGMIERLIEALGTETKIVATGGQARMIRVFERGGVENTSR